MFLMNYDYYDLYALITFFRNNPNRFTNYYSAIEEIIEYINTPSRSELNFNTIRTILKPYFDDTDCPLSWVLINNQYTANIHIIKNRIYYNILSTVFSEMVISNSDKQRFYLLCDVSHNIPLILTDSKHPKKTIRKMIVDYRIKYNKSFLVSELKQL